MARNLPAVGDAAEQPLFVEYVRAVIKHWAQAVVGPVVSIAGLIASSVFQWVIPPVLWLAVLLGLLVWAQFLAWKDMRAQRGASPAVREGTPNVVEISSVGHPGEVVIPAAPPPPGSALSRARALTWPTQHTETLLLVKVLNRAGGAAGFRATIQWLQPDGTTFPDYEPCEASWNASSETTRLIPAGEHRHLNVVALFDEYDDDGEVTPHKLLSLVRTLAPNSFYEEDKRTSDEVRVRVLVTQDGFEDSPTRQDFVIDVAGAEPRLVATDPVPPIDPRRAIRNGLATLFSDGVALRDEHVPIPSKPLEGWRLTPHHARVEGDAEWAEFDRVVAEDRASKQVLYELAELTEEAWLQRIESWAISTAEWLAENIDQAAYIEFAEGSAVSHPGGSEKRQQVLGMLNMWLENLRKIIDRTPPA